MRVLQIVQRPQRRGAEVFAYDLTRRFAKLGIDTRTVYLYESNGSSPLPLHDGDVCLYGSPGHLLERFPKVEPRLLKRVKSEIARFEPDIVQVNGARTVKYGALSKRLLGSRAHWKLVYRNIGIPSDWHRWWGSVLIYRKVIMPQMDGVIGVSENSLGGARSLYRLRVPSTVILNGISPDRLQVTVGREEFRRRQGVAEGDVVLLFLGFLDDVKRPERFIRVLAGVHRRVPGIHGWIVGDGPLVDRTKTLADELGVADKVRFFGAQEAVADFMGAADLFVMTSRTEGVPAVVLEAGFMGLPVVATRVGGLPECVREGETGLLSEPESQEEMTDSIVALATNPQRRGEMGEKAKAWVRDHLTIDQIADQYLEFYHRVRGEVHASPGSI